MPKHKQPAAPTTVDAVTDQLRSYATRGVFREFSATPHGARRMDYRFVWLTPRPMHAQFDARANVLKLVELLPGIESRSPMDKALREFLNGRFSPKLPAHRRLSKTLIRELKCMNRGGAMSLSLTLDGKQAAAATRQAVNLVSEIFQGFLAGPYHEYMVVNFDLRED